MINCFMKSWLCLLGELKKKITSGSSQNASLVPTPIPMNTKQMINFVTMTNSLFDQSKKSVVSKNGFQSRTSKSNGAYIHSFGMWMTQRRHFPATIRSNALFMSLNGRLCVMMSSIFISCTCMSSLLQLQISSGKIIYVINFSLNNINNHSF